MANQRSGFIDSLHAARLNFVTGVTHPTAPTGTYLALYAGAMPNSSGANGVEATGTRPAVTFGSAQQDSNGRYYIANTSAINITLTNTSAEQIVGFGIQGAATGGTPNYIGSLYPFQVQANATVTLPIGAVRVYAEGGN